MSETALLEEIIAIRRDIHQHPETGFDVERTAGIAAAEMEALGLPVRRGVGRTGVVADLEVPGASRRILLRADMDALPMDEESDLPFRSKHPGKAHMCGHDAHTAMLIGAARRLHGLRSELKCHVRFCFQPSEECLPGGAPGMIADGAVDGVDEAYALHVWPWLETGTVGICRGPTMAQADHFDITLKGYGGHAAAPHLAVDPVVVGAQLVTALQTLVSRTVDPLESVVVSVTEFKAGSAYNVIPETCQLRGTVRTYNAEVQKEVRRRMEEMVQKLPRGFGAEGSLTYTNGYPPVINAPSACDRVRKATTGLQVIDPASRALFGEDFAYFAQQVPACFVQLGCRNEDLGAVFPLHHPRFRIDEACLAVGIQILSGVCLQIPE